MKKDSRFIAKRRKIINVVLLTAFVVMTVLGFGFHGSINTVYAADTTYEGESISKTVSAGASQANYNDVNCSNGQFNSLINCAVNDYIQYTVNVATAGTYTVKVKSKHFYNKGIYQLSIAGTNIGSTVDQYSASATYPEIDFGNVTFSTTGDKPFRFTVTGKNASSSDYCVAIDCIVLSPTPSPTPIIIDNPSAEFTGTWITSTYKPDYYGANYCYKVSATGTNKVRWRPDITTAGNYNVYYLLPDGGLDRATNAPFTVFYNGGSYTYPVNEQPVPGGSWILLGTHTFAAGTSGYVELTDNANGNYVVADAVKFEYTTSPPTPAPTPTPGSGNYTVRNDIPKQTIWGLGVEIQSDSIGSGNNGLPESTTSVPHDLVESERTRMNNDLLHGFRYLRLAGGLYLRGLDAQQKQLQQRWGTQNQELHDMISGSGIEGIDFEYWSPTPYFKSNGSYIGGTLNQFDTTFLTEFGNAIASNIQYIQQNIGPVKMFGLQNEPHISSLYSTCIYDSTQYYNTFKVVAPIIKQAFPSMFIHNESGSGQYGRGSELIRGDSATLAYVDAWTWHKIGADSNVQIAGAGTYNTNTAGKYVFSNEYEYLSGGATDWRCINTAQSIMNWFAFEDSPTWFWLHALKPTYNSEASGYSLGFWRPYDDYDYSKYPDIQQGYWDYNWQNFNSIAGFLKYMPWDSVRYQVDEDVVRYDNRILAWETPEGKLCIALTNRSSTTPFIFNVNVGSSATFSGHRYLPNSTDSEGISQVNKTGSSISCQLPPLSIEFWVQQ